MADEAPPSGMAGTVLVTGGCGYIGSHTLVCLLQKGYNVVVVDNLINSNVVALDRVAEICGLTETERAQRLVFHEADLCDQAAMRKVFESSPTFMACIHFAGLKVGEYNMHAFLFLHRIEYRILLLYEMLQLQTKNSYNSS